MLNQIMGSSEQTPTVGMGATILMFTDRHAATIVAVRRDGKEVDIQRDRAKRMDRNGQSESQTYRFTPDPKATVETYTLRKNGRWVWKGQPLTDSARIAIGWRDEYYDPSF